MGRAVFRDVGERDLFFAAVLGVVEVDHLRDAVEEMSISTPVLHNKPRGKVGQHAVLVKVVEGGLPMVWVELYCLCVGVGHSLCVGCGKEEGQHGVDGRDLEVQRFFSDLEPALRVLMHVLDRRVARSHHVVVGEAMAGKEADSMHEVEAGDEHVSIACVERGSIICHII